jgi:predicted nicotinamide N-methyase
MHAVHVRQDEPAWIQGKRVLELGAGVGYVGLKVAALGAARVVLTDQQVRLCRDRFYPTGDLGYRGIRGAERVGV